MGHCKVLTVLLIEGTTPWLITFEGVIKEHTELFKVGHVKVAPPVVNATQLRQEIRTDVKQLFDFSKLNNASSGTLLMIIAHSARGTNNHKIIRHLSEIESLLIVFLGQDYDCCIIPISSNAILACRLVSRSC